jgi:hypothetical protein
MLTIANRLAAVATFLAAGAALAGLILTGLSVDAPNWAQQALHGLLARLRDLGLPLVSFSTVEPGTAAASLPAPSQEPSQ